MRFNPAFSRRALYTFVMALLLLLIAAGIGTQSVGAETSSTGFIQVQGRGYPPLKAQNRSQALLMTKRAAIMDAYRNAIGLTLADNDTQDGASYFKRLSGFVRGFKITGERYFSDGAVEISGRVSLSDIAVTLSETHRQNSGQKQPKASGHMPAPIGIQQWLETIDRFVIFPKNHEMGQQ